MLEEVIHLSKAKSTLFLGTLCWVLLFVFPEPGLDRSLLHVKLNENLQEIASLWLFLMAAMTFVAYLNHHGLIENLIYRFLPDQISEKKLLFLVTMFAFVFSSLADNITATLVSITLVLSLKLPDRETLKFTVAVVFAVNSGGVSLITGDVTTLMIFLGGKAQITDLMFLSLPALFAVLVLTTLLSFGLKRQVVIQKNTVAIDRMGIAVAVVFLVTIFSTITYNVVAGVPPVLSFLLGLATMFLIGRYLYPDDQREDLLDYLRVIEFDTLLFFLGILLLVGMLKEIGILDQLVQLYQLLPAVWANFSMGLMSALVDNVPLTAALLKANPQMTPENWLGLTYAVGVGGSMLIIGSAAGIVAMSKVKAVSFFSYLRYSFYLLLAYSIGFACSYLVGWLRFSS